MLRMLTTIITNIDNFEQLKPSIESLGKRHAYYQVKEEHYQVVGTALVYMLGRILGDAFTRQAERAWLKIFTMIANIMKATASEVVLKKQVVVGLTKNIYCFFRRKE